MKTQNNRLVKRILIGAGIILFILFMIPAGFGFYQGVKMHTGVSGEIEQSLLQHCNCEDVRQGISSFGVQISKEGVSNESLSYYLKGSDLSKASEEANRLNEILKAEIEDYSETDMIRLVFEDENTFEEIVIKNAIVTSSDI